MINGSSVREENDLAEERQREMVKKKKKMMSKNMREPITRAKNLLSLSFKDGMRVEGG